MKGECWETSDGSGSDREPTVDGAIHSCGRRDGTAESPLSATPFAPCPRRAPDRALSRTLRSAILPTLTAGNRADTAFAAPLVRPSREVRSLAAPALRSSLALEPIGRAPVASRKRLKR
jgi:hypothetical protein